MNLEIKTAQRMPRRDFLRKSLASAVGFSTLASGLLVPQTAYAGERDFVYSHFLCDSIENNSDFKGKLRLKEGNYSLGDIRDALLDQAVVVKGKKDPKGATYDVGDRFKLVFLQLRFPKDMLVTPIINRREFPDYKTKGNDWGYYVWPLRVEEPGDYDIDFQLTAPEGYHFGEKKTKMLDTGLKYHVRNMLNGSATFGSP